jgi:hypothetical protein
LKRGPKTDYESAAKVLAIVGCVAPDGNLRKHEYEIREALDADSVEFSKTWRKAGCKCWQDQVDVETAIKAIKENSARRANN